MYSTPFPTRPIDVVALTVQEFMSDLDMDHAPSLDVICRRFVADVNLALVWWIRFRALKAWCTRADMIIDARAQSADAENRHDAP